MSIRQFSDQKEASVENLLEYANSSQGFPIELVTQYHQLDRPITLNETNRPSLNLLGIFEYFAYQRVQIIGQGEYFLLLDLFKKNHLEHIEKFFSYDLPCILFSHNKRPTDKFIKMADEKNIPILVSSLSTNELTDRIYDFFAEYLYVSGVIHGLMMEIFGIGVLVISNSESLSLSEYGLELIERGHFLVADDVVNLKKQKGKHLLAFTSDMIAHHMKITGIGIINVAHLFGVKSILHQKSVDFIIEVEYYDNEKEYENIGNSQQYRTILEIEVPKVQIPVSHGVKVPILIETATMNHRLKMTGYNPAEEFDKRVIKYTNRLNKE